MARSRLSPEEREARRRARNAFTFSDAAYKHYDTSKHGFGNASQWEHIAEELFDVNLYDTPYTKFSKHLSILGIDSLPFSSLSMEVLKTAFHKTMFRVHPDHGGTNEETREAMEAFVFLKHQIEA